MKPFSLCPSVPKGFLRAFNIYVQKELSAAILSTLSQIKALCFVGLC
jgi:hypothetical protein